MKILELTNYSKGGCGVFSRVKQEALELIKKGHKVTIFSSNFTKGSNEIACKNEILEGIKIKRFPAKKIGGESFMKWDFESEAVNLSPDIIICHSYRHLHTIKALKVAKKLKKIKKCKIFLVTHAPFIENNKTRSIFQSIIVNLYDLFFARTYINKFDKIIAITNWEYPNLKKIGVKSEKIVYIPNGLQKEYFLIKQKKGKNIFFLGRISPVKNLETLIFSASLINKKISLIGPIEEDYFKKLKDLINKNNINNIEFLEAVYDLKKKIDLMDKYEIFVLPSKTEAMPQALIEAMARGKIVISSKTPGGREIVKDNVNGFLFDIGNSNQLSEIINNISNMSEKEKDNIIKNSLKTSQKFKWSNLIKDLEKLF